MAGTLESHLVSNFLARARYPPRRTRPPRLQDLDEVCHDTGPFVLFLSFPRAGSSRGASSTAPRSAQEDGVDMVSTPGPPPRRRGGSDAVPGLLHLVPRAPPWRRPLIYAVLRCKGCVCFFACCCCSEPFEAGDDTICWPAPGPPGRRPWRWSRACARRRRELRQYFADSTPFELHRDSPTANTREHSSRSTLNFGLERTVTMRRRVRLRLLLGTVR